MKVIKDFVRNWVLPPRIFLELRRNAHRARKFSFENQKLFEKNKALKNRHKGKGERCFILGGGPSIKDQDLKKLKGEHVVSVTQTFVHPDFHIFRPQYHVWPALIANCPWPEGRSQSVALMRESEQKTFDAELFFHVSDKRAIEENGLFKNRKIYWNEYCPWDESERIHDIDLAAIPDIWSVSEYALSVAIYLGFEEIYLIGLDHDWYNGVSVHFYDEKDNIFQAPGFFSYVDSEYQMRRHAYIFRKYKALRTLHKKIYNANANLGTYVDVFPKVEFDSLFPKPGK